MRNKNDWQPRKRETGFLSFIKHPLVGCLIGAFITLAVSSFGNHLLVSDNVLIGSLIGFIIGTISGVIIWVRDLISNKWF